MATRAGLYNQDMEFVQFHPTGTTEETCRFSEARRSLGQGSMVSDV